jgi:hypothetical protein
MCKRWLNLLTFDLWNPPLLFGAITHQIINAERHLGSETGRQHGAILIRSQAVDLVHDENIFTYKGNPVTQVSGKAWWMHSSEMGSRTSAGMILATPGQAGMSSLAPPVQAPEDGGGRTEMVLKYAHLAPEHLAADAKNIDGLLSGIGTNLSQNEAGKNTKKSS